MGVVFFVLYYFLFRFAIKKWNMRTPGREDEASSRRSSGEPDRRPRRADARGRRDRRAGAC